MSKGELRRRYLRARNRLKRLMEPYDCGIELASYINPKIAAAQADLELVIAEVHQKMAEERA